MENFFPTTEKLDKTIKKKPKEDPVGLFLERFGKALDVEHIVLDKIDFSHLNPDQQAESLWSVFKNVVEKSIFKLRDSSVKKLETKEKERLQLSLGIIKKLYENTEVKAKYLEAYKKHIEEAESINGNLEKYELLKHQIKDARSISDEQAKQMFSQRGGGTSEVDLLLFETSKRQSKEKQRELSSLVESDPELGGLVEYDNIKDYANQLQKEKFIWTPSRLELLEEMEEASLSGHPVLLSGESGTGKTRLVEQVALKLTGRINNLTPGKDVRFQDLIAKPKISPSGETYYEYKEIGEAATGRFSTLEEKPKHDGRMVADDEFNLLSEAEQTERLARIAAWTPGKKTRMPVTNQEVNIAGNFLYCAMVNLASERYTRKKIPPEVLRKFAKVDVDYPKQTETEPEIYEMTLSALMDENGRIKVAREDLAPFYEEREEARNIEKEGQEIKQTVRIRELRMQTEEDGKKVMAGGFLWRLSNALGELNKSFSHKETVLKSKGEAQYLKDMIIDIGTILGWMKEYSSLGRTKNPEEFFCKRIQKQFLAREAYTKEDKQLIKEFLEYFDIDVDKKSEDRKKHEFKIMTPLEIGLLSPRVKYEKVIEEEPVLAESFFITPEGKRVEYKIEKYREGDREFLPGQIFPTISADGKKYAEQFLGVNKETGAPAIVPYKKIPKRYTKEKEPVASKTIKTKWQNPETGNDQGIEINLEKILEGQKRFYKDKLNLEIDEAEIKSIWNENYAEIQKEIEKYGYDAILVIPENLPEEETLNQKLIETMRETVSGRKEKVTATWQGDNFKEGGSFAGVRNSYAPKYRLVLTHSVQNIEDHPILKATCNKDVMQVTGLDPTEVERRIASNARTAG